VTASAAKRVLELVPARRPFARRTRTSLAPLIGRDDVIARVQAELAAGARIVTLTGPPGIGKTRVAAACFERLSSEYADEGGAWFSELSHVKTEKELAFAALTALGNRVQVEHLAEQDIEERMVDGLVDAGRTLLVLDNFEQIVFAAPLIERWCRAAPELAVLVTSRERLAIEGEVVIELGPLACPREDDDPGVIALSDAVRLFVKRAHDAGQIVQADAQALGAIVRRLEGIPLAIELAAARTRVLSLGELSARLAVDHKILQHVTRRVESRHSTLASAIGWSWSLLTPTEQLALARCSVFAGSFSAEAAEKVIGASDSLELIGALRDKSLLHSTDDGRLALYVSIRDYASTRLCELEAEEPVATRIRHARVFAEMARRFNETRSLLGPAPEPGAHLALRREKEEIVAALMFVRDLPTSEEHALLRAPLAIAAALLHALPGEACVVELSRALAALGERSAEAAHVLLQRQLVYASLGRHEERLADLEALATLPSAPRGYALVALAYRGIQLRFRGFAREAWASHVEAAEQLRGADFPRLSAMNEACIGRLAGDLGELSAARLHNERAIELAEAAADSWLGALALANLAQIEQEEGHFERANELLADAVGRLRRGGEEHYEAIYASVCGDLFFEWGKHDVARRWYAEGFRFFRNLMAHRQTAIAHAAAAALEAHDGDFVRPRELVGIARHSASRARNRVVDVIVGIHAATVELICAAERERARAVDAMGAKLQAWSRPDDEDGAVVSASLDARFALRMAKRALERARSCTPGRATPRTLVVAKDGRWFQVDDGPRAELGRRGPPRRILLALCARHAKHPNEGIKLSDLVGVGWPGERLLFGAASTRVRVAIALLRQLGLRSVLMTRDDGYLLDSAARVTVRDDGGA
jgi:predicted ATPase